MDYLQWHLMRWQLSGIRGFAPHLRSLKMDRLDASQETNAETVALMSNLTHLATRIDFGFSHNATLLYRMLLPLTQLHTVTLASSHRVEVFEAVQAKLRVLSVRSLEYNVEVNATGNKATARRGIRTGGGGQVVFGALHSLAGALSVGVLRDLSRLTPHVHDLDIVEPSERATTMMPELEALGPMLSSTCRALTLSNARLYGAKSLVRMLGVVTSDPTITSLTYHKTVRRRPGGGLACVYTTCVSRPCLRRR
jgi:hypothetical protein